MSRLRGGERVCEKRRINGSVLPGKEGLTVTAFSSSPPNRKRPWLVRKEGGRPNAQASESQPGGRPRGGGGDAGGVSLQNCLVAERLRSQQLQGGKGLRKAMGGLKGPVCRGTLTPGLAGPG